MAKGSRNIDHHMETVRNANKIASAEFSNHKLSQNINIIELIKKSKPPPK